jgi:predicted ribosomally synthesized peptide with nif11-like leader
MESARKFIEKMETDEDFRKKVNECKDTETRMTFVKAEGFDFIEDDIKAVKVELSDEELECVVGGGTDLAACWLFGSRFH